MIPEAGHAGVDFHVSPILAHPSGRDRGLPPGHRLNAVISILARAMLGGGIIERTEAIGGRFCPGASPVVGIFQPIGRLQTGGLDHKERPGLVADDGNLSFARKDHGFPSRDIEFGLGPCVILRKTQNQAARAQLGRPRVVAGGLEPFAQCIPFFFANHPEHLREVPILAGVSIWNPLVPERRLIERKDDFAGIPPDDQAEQAVANGNAFIPA